ncbi:DNA adenine methylase [Arthrobacter koreensis]|uniref:DNA adenine methylase n=1 Tax=Arthrobacter koreensis TaxID=199136 RepID=UPI002DBF8EF6|nr:DNA adenine methylase [Arthrobacter koreensis]MEB7448173.1 DNA adenine methylase [Arthrobacter koreensis]
MGSKIAMLNAGLSEAIDSTLKVGPARFVDLFSGSGAVARWVAVNYALPVEAVDTQEYAKVLSGAIIERNEKASASVLNDWIMASHDMYLSRSSDFELNNDGQFSSAAVYAERDKARFIDTPGFVARQYGGHYYSLKQGIAFDCLLECLPPSAAERSVALAAVIESASSCAASPGHTAQPFQPSTNLVKHIESAWKRDPFAFVARKADSFAARYALSSGGRAWRADALGYVRDMLPENSVVFCDPPYSEVQYSRFYHVLEGIAVGGWQDVHGAGRAPSGEHRFSSAFSSRKDSSAAFSDLFQALAAKSATVILTFPNHDCSNGQSSEALRLLAHPWYEVAITSVEVTHSSLGASEISGGGRVPRKNVKESVMVLSPIR